MEKEINGIKGDLEIIERCQKETILLSRASGILGWDMQTYMPKGGAESRAEQLAVLDSIIHKKMISDEFFEAIERLANSPNKLNEKQKVIVKKLYKDIGKARKLPAEFIEKLSRATALSFNAWQEAREKKDFEIFKPHLKKVVELKREQAKFIGLPGSPYNSLLDGYEEGMTVEKFSKEFDNLKKGLIEIIKSIENSKAYRKQSGKNKTEKEFSKESQMELVQEISEKLGFSKESFRIDFSEHPFSIGIGKKDVRITTNIRKDPLFAFSSSMHEMGHAMYNLNMPSEDEYNVLYDSPSYGMHESQSRFWENMIGKSRPFWEYFFPKFKEKFGLKESVGEWYHKINTVFPGKIRIESDEVHYCLHIILRFELEKGLIEGKIDVEQFPELWNEKMREYFGEAAVPKNDKDGVMQDVHWSNGSFGYFPTYALGTIYASQLYEAVKKDIPDLEKEIAKGDFSKIEEWLHEKVQKYGAFYLAEDLIKMATGRGLDVNVYLNYLRKKYFDIYGLE